MKEVKFTFTAGALIRGEVKRGLESFLFMNTESYNITEQKGFLVSEFLVSFTCEDEKEESICSSIYSSMKDYEKRLGK